MFHIDCDILKIENNDVSIDLQDVNLNSRTPLEHHHDAFKVAYFIKQT